MADVSIPDLCANENSTNTDASKDPGASKALDEYSDTEVEETESEDDEHDSTTQQNSSQSHSSHRIRRDIITEIDLTEQIRNNEEHTDLPKCCENEELNMGKAERNDVSEAKPAPKSQDTAKKRDRSQDADDITAVTHYETKRPRQLHQTSPASNALQEPTKSNVAVEKPSSSLTAWKPINQTASPQHRVDKASTTQDPRRVDSDNVTAAQEVTVNSKVSSSPAGNLRSTSKSLNDPTSSASDTYIVAITKSGITEREGLMKFLRSKCKVQEQVDNSVDILCVGKVTTTSKLLLAVIKGIPIVSDDWIVRSAKAGTGTMLDPEDFTIRDKHFKSQHGRFLADAAGRPADKLFSDHLICITPALKKSYGAGFADIKQICIAAGARGVVTLPARELLKRDDEFIVIGLVAGDLDATSLYDNGHPIYDKAFLSGSILRGKILWNGAYRITPRSGK